MLCLTRSDNTNEYIFRTKPKEADSQQGGRRQGDFPDLELKNVSLNYKRPKRKKDYSAMVHQFKCSAKDVNGVLTFKVNVKLMARTISFNTKRGSYMTE